MKAGPFGSAFLLFSGQQNTCSNSAEGLVAAVREKAAGAASA